MDRSNMQRAAKLLAKAQGTQFDPEAIALVEKSYRILADVITAYEDEEEETSVDARSGRRERRYLRDRRGKRRLGPYKAPSDAPDPAAAYRQRSQGSRSRDDLHIDLSA